MQFSKQNLKTGMVVGVSHGNKQSPEELIYGVVIFDENEAIIRYISDNHTTLFDELSSMDDRLIFKSFMSGGVVEVYENIGETMKRLPFTMKQFRWTIKKGYYEKTWSREKDGEKFTNLDYQSTYNKPLKLCK